MFHIYFEYIYIYDIPIASALKCRWSKEGFIENIICV